MSFPIYDITPFTLIDFPHKTACIVWFAGCNMRCGYCYNPDIVLGKGKLSFDDVFLFLHKRKNLLDAVVLSGGECTIHKHLSQFIKAIKAMGFLVKIDTNGSNPSLLKKLIDENLIDYVSLDFKAPSSEFEKVTHSNFFYKFAESLDILNSSRIEFEVRTTFHSALLNKNDVKKMSEFLLQKNYSKPFYIQHAVNHAETLENLPASKNEINDEFIASSPIEIIVRN